MNVGLKEAIMLQKFLQDFFRNCDPGLDVRIFFGKIYDLQQARISELAGRARELNHAEEKCRLKQKVQAQPGGIWHNVDLYFGKLSRTLERLDAGFDLGLGIGLSRNLD